MSTTPPNYDWPPLQDQSTSSYNLTTRILTTTILSITFVLILLAVLHLYVRFVLRGSPRTIRIASQTTAEPPRANGLNHSTVDSLPTFSYRKDGKDEAPLAECPICLSVVDEGEMVRVLPGCQHLFHAECIDMWLHAHLTCPVCRARVEAVDDRLNDSGVVSRLGSLLRRMMCWERSGGRGAQGVGLEGLERQS